MGKFLQKGNDGLGYLSYDREQRTSHIPNREVATEFKNAMKLVGINYDKATEKHECRIESV